jgi:hypothetical protein
MDQLRQLIAFDRVFTSGNLASLERQCNRKEVTAMIAYRTPSTAPAGSADDCFRAMERHATIPNGKAGTLPAALPQPKAPASIPPGDTVYGARAIARFIFDEDGNRARRRVFNLWTHFQHREERAGFFKLKGALCLSKSQWLAFHRPG